MKKGNNSWLGAPRTDEEVLAAAVSYKESNERSPALASLYELEQRREEVREDRRQKMIVDETFINDPSRTLYRPEYCARVVRLMRVGFSKNELAAELGVCSRTLLNWAKKHPEFKAAMEIGETAALAYFERLAQVGMLSKQFNAQVLSLIMANRFGWVHRMSDKQINVTVEERGSFEDRARAAQERARRKLEELDETVVAVQ